MSEKNESIEKINVEHTNSANDSSGSVEVAGVSFAGNQFLIPLVCMMLSVVLVVVFTVTDAFVSFGPGGQWAIAFLPFVASIGWMIAFVVNKPPRYQADFFTQLFRGGNIDTFGSTPFHGIFGQRASFRQNHPLLVTRRREIKKDLEGRGLSAPQIAIILKDLEHEMAI